MRFLIVTGMSGAGKSTALKVLEDMGYFCIDNLPIFLMVSFGKLLHTPNSGIGNVAVGIDIRSGEALQELESTLTRFEESNFEYEILYLDCSTETLVKRYKETRRSHPLAQHGRMEDGIGTERKKIAFLKERADYILDTSDLLTRQLQNSLEKIFSIDTASQKLKISVISFGYKYGLPSDADLVLDVRFLPNPYYVAELKDLTGNDQPVQDFVTGFPECKTFLEKLYDLFDFLIPRYVEEDRSALVIAVGCTGGKHRSVTLANTLSSYMQKMDSVSVSTEHRDILKGKAV